MHDNYEFVPDGEADGDGAEVPLDLGPTMEDEFSVREGDPDHAGSVPGTTEAGSAGPAAEAGPGASEAIVGAKIAELAELADERTADLQRLQAEYANYKKRVDRDRDLARQRGVESVVLDLLPVLDSVEAAKLHEELTGGFKLVADELEKIGAKYGLVTYGAVGEPFDPQVHEALMHMPLAGDHDSTVVSAVMQKGAMLNERVIRPARVGVHEPE